MYRREVGLPKLFLETPDSSYIDIHFLNHSHWVKYSVYDKEGSQLLHIVDGWFSFYTWRDFDPDRNTWRICLKIQVYSGTTLRGRRGPFIPSGILGMSPILIHQVYVSNRDEDSGPWGHLDRPIRVTLTRAAFLPHYVSSFSRQRGCDRVRGVSYLYAKKGCVDVSPIIACSQPMRWQVSVNLG